MPVITYECPTCGKEIPWHGFEDDCKECQAKDHLEWEKTLRTNFLANRSK